MGGLTATGRLLNVARAGEEAGRKRNPFPPLLHLLSAILLCSVARPYLAEDVSGVYLPAYLLALSVLGVIITLSFIGRTGAEIVRKTRIYPDVSSAAYYFLLAGSLRRPELYLFAAVGSVFPATLFARSASGASGIVALALLPLLVSQILLCAAAVRLIRGSRPLSGLVLVSAAGAAVVTASAVVFRTDAVASAIPLIGWSASGIAAFAGGLDGAGWEQLGWVALATAAVAGLFRR